MKIRIPHGPAHLTLFLLLAFLCYQAHQLLRHLVGAGLCGGFGSMTFTVATTKQPCSLPTIVILSGPVLTYGLAYAGMFLLRLPKLRLFAYALVFASFAHLRFIQNLTRGGDELILAQQWFGVSSRFFVAALVFLIGLPPVIAAFYVIGNRHRLRVFIGSLLLPIPLLMVLLFGSTLLFERSDMGWQYGPLFGIPSIVWMIDLAALALFILLAPRYLRSPGED
jgi:hypothetical protein